MKGREMAGQRSRLPRVAVVDDDVILLETWREMLARSFDVRSYADAHEAMRAFEGDDLDVALLDVQLPGKSGLDLLSHLRRVQPGAEAIMITGNATVEMAVAALHAGAFDFLQKPIENPEWLLRRVTNAVERALAAGAGTAAGATSASQSPSDARPRIVGVSSAIERVRALIEHFANSSSATLITGESGTGKELVARALRGRRAARIALRRRQPAARSPTRSSRASCFGHERGAFTGAHARHTGLFDAADGGVLFLDEIGDMPLQTQVRLLRVLQEGEVPPRRARRRATPSTCASSRRRTSTSSAPCATASSARISITGSPRCASTCPRCATASRTSR